MGTRSHLPTVRGLLGARFHSSIARNQLAEGGSCCCRCERVKPRLHRRRRRHLQLRVGIFLKSHVPFHAFPTQAPKERSEKDRERSTLPSTRGGSFQSSLEFMVVCVCVTVAVAFAKRTEKLKKGVVVAAFFVVEVNGVDFFVFFAILCLTI